MIKKIFLFIGIIMTYIAMGQDRIYISVYPQKKPNERILLFFSEANDTIKYYVVKKKKSNLQIFIHYDNVAYESKYLKGDVEVYTKNTGKVIFITEKRFEEKYKNLYEKRMKMKHMPIAFLFNEYDFYSLNNFQKQQLLDSLSSNRQGKH